MVMGTSKNPYFVTTDSRWSSQETTLLKNRYPLHIKYVWSANFFLEPGLA